MTLSAPIPPPSKHIAEQVSTALAEDIGTGDITAKLIPPNQTAHATIKSNEKAIICGIPWALEVFRQVDADIKVDWLVSEGETITPSQTLCKLSGNARNLLTAERTVLNFLQTLSATATTTAHYCSLIKDSGATLLDTRKTIPGYRMAQKYAVRCGGGANHRVGLYDAFLIKENHILASSTLTAAIEAARALIEALPDNLAPDTIVEVEVENFAELEAALHAQADVILLDNFKLDALKKAVAFHDAFKQQHNKAFHTKLEASGSVEERTLVAIAETGVDYISVGALTKHIQAIDLSMRFQLAEIT